MALSRALVAILACMPHVAKCDKMTCGDGVPMCGVLVLQSGFGSGVYHSAKPGVHGLWPEVGDYGTSKCVKPQNTADATKIYPCYVDPTDTGVLSFENHEWEKHGQCAGVKDVDDFFGQVCTLSKDALSILGQAKTAGKDFHGMAQALKDQKYPVWYLDEQNDQVYLSACSGSNGQWILAETSEFPSKCGGSSPGPSPGPAPTPPAPVPTPPAPAPSPSGGSCVPNKKGPKCSADTDCKGLSGCVRCAHSGYCTDQPLASQPFLQV